MVNIDSAEFCAEDYSGCMHCGGSSLSAYLAEACEEIRLLRKVAEAAHTFFDQCHSTSASATAQLASWSIKDAEDFNKVLAELANVGSNHDSSG